MLVTLDEVLEFAKKEGNAVGSFNTPGLEMVMAVLRSAEELASPVIIMHAELHEEVMPLRVIGPIMVEMARSASVPVCVHLDHGETLEYLEQALEMGFSSVMFDGSLLPYEENAEKTKATVAMARRYGAGVEAEIGVLGGREAGGKPAAGADPSDQYTDPALAERFVAETGIDALACSFGTAHGFYAKKPVLDFARIETIRKLVDVPLVMHGGSGLSAGDFHKAIAAGIRKINYYSYMSRAGVESVENLMLEGEQKFYHDLARAATAGMAANAAEAIKTFRCV